MSAQRKTKRAAAPKSAAVLCVVCGHGLFGAQAARSNVCGGGTECVCFPRKQSESNPKGGERDGSSVSESATWNGWQADDTRSTEASDSEAGDPTPTPAAEEAALKGGPMKGTMMPMPMPKGKCKPPPAPKKKK